MLKEGQGETEPKVEIQAGGVLYATETAGGLFMAWQIDCGNPQCQQTSWAGNIVEVIQDFCGEDGILVCPYRKKPSGFVRKSFNLQEEGEIWEPILRGVIKLGADGDTYQPFVYLACYEQTHNEVTSSTAIIDLPITDLWFSYYKDLRGHVREDGSPGRLKMGYGPGGPPVIGVPQLIELLRHVLRLKMAQHSDIAALLHVT